MGSKTAAQKGRIFWSKMYGLLHVEDIVASSNSTFDPRSGRCTKCNTYVGDQRGASGGVQLFKHKIFYSGVEDVDDHDVEDVDGSDKKKRNEKNLFDAHSDACCVGLVLRDALEVNNSRQFRLFLEEKSSSSTTSTSATMFPDEGEQGLSSPASVSTTASAGPPADNLTATTDSTPTSTSTISTSPSSSTTTSTTTTSTTTINVKSNSKTSSSTASGAPPSIVVKVVAKRTKLLNLKGDMSESASQSQLFAQQEETAMKEHMCVWYRIENYEASPEQPDHATTTTQSPAVPMEVLLLRRRRKRRSKRRRTIWNSISSIKRLHLVTVNRCSLLFWLTKVRLE